MAFWRLLGLGGVLAVAISVPLRADAQAAGSVPDQPPEAAQPLNITPQQIARVQRALGQKSALRLDERQLRFYLEIIARQPTFAEYTRGYDFLNGPTRRGNPMTHQEFLNMVTPKEMYSSDLVPALDRLQAAFTNWIGQSLIKKALDELKDAKDAREIQEIRERINRELEALTSAGRGTPQTPRSTAE